MNNNKKEKSIQISHISRFFTGSLRIHKEIFIFRVTALTVFILLNYGLMHIEAQIPELPEWVTEVYFVDPGNSKEGDGSYENPWRDLRVSECYSTAWPRTGWDCGNCAILFKRGTSVGTEQSPLGTSLRFNVDNTYIGSYGTGHKPKLVFNSGTRSFTLEGENNRIAGLELMNMDTLTDVLEIRGGPPGVTGAGNRVDSLVISGGYRGITFSRNKDLVISNTVVYNTMDDGIFGGEEGNTTDSVVISGVHVHGVNKRYRSDPTNSSGGDCVQIRSAYLFVENSVLDHSKYGMKFCLINTRTSDNAKTIVKNTKFLMHPHDNHGIYAQNVHIEKCYFEGGGTVLTIWGNSSVYNSVFKGYGKDYHYSHSGNNFYNIPVYAALLDIYNCTFTDVYTAVQATQRDINIRNSIFYNVKEAFKLGINGINGSGNIHYNDDLSIQAGLFNYLHDDGKTKGNLSAYITEDPLFIDHLNGDYRLSENSPAIDAGDPKVYDRDSTFISGYNTGSGWAYYERKFTEHHHVKTDYNGIPRPVGNGYDIGAFEYYWFDPDNSKRKQIIISPNPASSYINLLYFFDDQENMTNLSIFNTMGRKMHNETVLFEKQGFLRMELNNFPPGMYFLRLNTNKESNIVEYFTIVR